ncbi:glycoside hydrolase family 3 protein [Fulvivirga sp. M361]|uniref:glycoside hydrolase family 3 protein n=1 Tax=Fulvivirga sp. M361 TaxID=2594266 RepID=UPI001179DF34|nr:glycoside hydrolase family 3 N-terminal domain-containing protein [Fulvivirga sp. M361]TRX58369.1 glycoside hydrolase family 3 protein [Fulvivirga sp. M361]
MKNILYIILLILPGLASAQNTDSLDIKIGQMIMVGFSSQTITSNDPTLKEIREGKVGGVVLFEKNIQNRNSYIGLKQLTWALQSASPEPLFVALDHEGGKVNRLKEKYKFPKTVSAKYLGELGNMDSIRFYGEIYASTLAGLGFNVNFAPVVDLAINKDNPVIHKIERSYSDDPDKMVLFAEQMIESHDRYGVVSVLKHFPGHGSSHADTHLGIADVTPYWQSKEIMPYRILIDKKQVQAVMTAHIVNKRLDKRGLPGTLSKPIVTGLLRDSLNFNGVVFSDDMQMHAITKYYGLEKAIKLSIQAGVDVLIFSNNIPNSDERTVDAVHRIVRQLVESGELSTGRIDASYRRIKRLKAGLY